MQLTEKQKSEGWRIVKFGEIAKSVSKRVDPADTDLEVYVGLEHLDPDNLRITRRGVPSDVKGQKLLVKPGQIIFGKRRAYQRKVAVADFEGICSAHAMVLEAIPEAVVPEYLPFFMQSDMFMERAVAISEGSLSPTIKWKTLANQEFPLPPGPRQEELSSLFYALDKSAECNKNIYTSAFQKKISLMSFHIHHSKKYEETKLGSVVECLDNKRIPLNDAERSKRKGPYPYWGANGVVDYIDDFIFEEDCILLAEDGGYFNEYNHRPIANIARGKYWVNNHAHILKPKSSITLEFLYYTLVHKNIIGFVNPGTRAKLNQKDMLKIPIKLPGINTQKSISHTLNAIVDIEKKSKEKIDRILKIKNSLFQTIFEGEAA